MTEPTDAALPHRELDGENTAEESAAFLRRIDGDPVLREGYERLVWLKAALARLGPSDPPPGFGADVMRAVRRSASGQARKQGWLEAFRAPFVRRPAFGYALTAAAGIVAGTFLVGPLARHARVSPTDGSAAGTILPDDRLGEHDTGIRQSLMNDGLQGEVSTTEAGGRVRVEIRLDSEGPLDLSLGFDPEMLSVAGFERRGGVPGTVGLTQGEVLIGGAGIGRYTISLDRLTPGRWGVRLKITGKGVQLQKVLEGNIGG
jgi:hypothetical protein